MYIYVAYILTTYIHIRAATFHHSFYGSLSSIQKGLSLDPKGRNCNSPISEMATRNANKTNTHLLRTDSGKGDAI